MKIKIKKEKTKSGNEIKLFIDGKLRMNEIVPRNDLSKSIIHEQLFDHIYRFIKD